LEQRKNGSGESPLIEKYLGYPIKASIAERTWDSALFNLAIVSKLRASDLTRLRFTLTSFAAFYLALSHQR